MFLLLKFQWEVKKMKACTVVEHFMADMRGSSDICRKCICVARGTVPGSNPQNVSSIFGLFEHFEIYIFEILYLSTFSVYAAFPWCQIIESDRVTKNHHILSSGRIEKITTF